MNVNAMQAAFEEITVLDKPALFTSLRVARNTVPQGLFAYDVRHDDEDGGTPVQIAKGIMVNHFGTILLAEPLALPPDGCLEIDPEQDWNFIPVDEAELPAGRLEYLTYKGDVGYFTEYCSMDELAANAKDDLNCGMPISIVLYQYGTKPPQHAWTDSLDCLPKGFQYEKRTDDRRKPCRTVSEFMKAYLPNQQILMRPAPPKHKSKENER